MGLYYHLYFFSPIETTELAQQVHSRHLICLLNEKLNEVRDGQFLSSISLTFQISSLAKQKQRNLIQLTKSNLPVTFASFYFSQSQALPIV